MSAVPPSPSPAAERDNDAPPQNAFNGSAATTENGVAPQQTERQRGEKEEEDEKDKLSVDELVKSGERNLANKKYSEAADEFSRAVEKLTSSLGSDLAPDPLLARSFLLYGRSLLLLHVSTSSALGGAPEAKAGDVAEPSANSGPSGERSANARKIQIMEREDEDDEDGAGEEAGEDGEEEEGEEEDDLESAFGVLEQARLVWMKLLNGEEEGDKGGERNGKGKESQEVDERKKDWSLQLGLTYELLGEVQLENGNFELALNEYRESLAIMEKAVDPDDRMLGSTNYMIALCLDGGWKETEKKGEALFHTESALRVLERRRDRLTGNPAGPQEAEKDRREIADIEEMIKEMGMKIEDLKAIIAEPPAEQALLPSERAVLDLIQRSPTKKRMANDGSFVAAPIDGEVKDLAKMGLVKRKNKGAAGASQQVQGNNANPFGFVTELINGAGTNTTDSSSIGTGAKRKMADEEMNEGHGQKKARLSEEE
ncbi:hypothetical protein BT69DRAFT_1349537 [Atractiella rhizophila]|nr:hypothetical protein BT69DRAFT_1349537 [Atractiella rhizophila]